MNKDSDRKERLRSHLQQLVRERDPDLATAGHFFVQQYIRAELGQWGEVETHEFVYQNRTHSNVILDLPGTSQSDRPILIGAHYDAVVGTPGADDNASGVATLLELAQAFAAQPAHHPVRLVAFDLEEPGRIGSDFYAEILHQQRQALRLMLSLEMVGYCTQAPNSQKYPVDAMKLIYPSEGNFIGLIGNLPTLPDLLHFNRHINQLGVPSRWLPAGMRGKLVPVLRFSDHSRFWDRGYRAMMVTDTAFLRNPHYHKASDRLETLDLDFMAEVCQGLIRAIQTLL